MAPLRRTQWPAGPGKIGETGRGIPGSGFWAVEADCVPPAAHHPGRLLSGCAAAACMAVTLRTATMLSLNLANLVADRLGGEGCVLAPMASLALHEILVNAAIHGNLDVRIGDIAAWRDIVRRERLIAAALDDPAKSGRLVTLAVGWGAQSVAAIVIDEGRGYTPAARHTPDVCASHLATGRGLMVARAAGHVDVLRGGCCTRLIFSRAAPDHPA